MNRAERRRQEKAAKKSQTIYHLTADEIDKIKRDAKAEAEAHANQILLDAKKRSHAVIDAELNQQILDADARYAADMDAAVLWTLHELFGFGYGRLRKFWETHIDYHMELRKIYGDGCGPFKCRMDLKRIGVDVDAWNAELAVEVEVKE